MKLKERSKLKSRIISSILRFISDWENKGNADMDTNGEKKLLEDIIAFYKNKKTNMIVFDVGASVGEYSDLFLKTAEREKVAVEIHCFEPLKESFNKLQKRLGASMNININNFGLSDKESENTIFYDLENKQIASLYDRNLTMYGNKLEESESVKLKTGLYYIEERAMQKIHFLKLDVEGHEKKVLSGFGDFLKNVDFIQFEYGNCNIDSNTRLFEIYSILQKYGFRIGRVMEKYIELQAYSKQMEDYTYSNFLAIHHSMLKTIHGEK